MVAVLETTATLSLQRGTPKSRGFHFPKVNIMSTKTLSKETEIRLTNFFNQNVTPEQMAKALRQVNFVLSLSLIRENETLQQEIPKLENSFYWLNELAEILNPYLDVE
jgi:hypothetical protein